MRRHHAELTYEQVKSEFRGYDARQLGVRKTQLNLASGLDGGAIKDWVAVDWNKEEKSHGTRKRKNWKESVRMCAEAYLGFGPNEFAMLTLYQYRVMVSEENVVKNTRKISWEQWKAMTPEERKEFTGRNGR